MQPLVFPQVPRLPECLLTNATRIRSFSRMNATVPLQNTRLGERLVANLALIRSLSRVDTLVDGQRVLLREHLKAEGAGEGGSCGGTDGIVVQGRRREVGRRKAQFTIQVLSVEKERRLEGEDEVVPVAVKSQPFQACGIVNMNRNELDVA